MATNKVRQLPFNFSGPLALLTVDEIYEKASVELLQRLGDEDRRVERKPATVHSEYLGEYFSMWANTAPDGGIIVVGMNDDRTVSGCDDLTVKQLNRLEATRVEYCPDSRSESKRIEAINAQGKPDYLLLFRVYYRSDKVVRTVSHKAYTRVADKKKELGEEEIRELQIDKGEVDFELEPCELQYPENFEADLVRVFTERYSVMRGLSSHSDEEILVLARLGKRQGATFVPNMACALLFAKDPRMKFPGCFIRFFRFEGEAERTGEKYNAVKDLRLEGNIPKQITAIETVLDSQLREFSMLGKGGKFYTVPEYPKPAWYEAVVNACVHRSYSLRTMNVFVKMFDDRLEVESPGGFPPLVNPNNIYDVHKPRNPYLMEALFYLEFVKCAHEGTRRMRDTMEEMNLPAPEFRQIDSTQTPLVKVVLRNNVRHRRVWIDSNISALVGEAVMKELSQDEIRAINFSAEYGQIGVSDLQRLTGRSWPSAKKLLLGLVRKKILAHQVRDELDRDPKARFFLRVPGPPEKEKPVKLRQSEKGP